MNLEGLLKTQVEESGVKFTPDFRVAVQNTNKHNGIHIIIHPNGYNGETLDFVVRGNSLEQL